ncbi:hypothetical protein [Methylobacterium crusticola]|nr:hypothetical protein [Methylobacterium crusticola]
MLIREARRRSNLPTYVPARSFASALIDIVGAPRIPGESLTVASLRDAVERIDHNDRLRGVLLTAIDGAQGDLDRVRSNLEMWYNATMDRVSGWYKRRTQAILALLGLSVAILFNIDAVQVAQNLNTDKAYRQAVVNQAGTLLRTDEGARGAPQERLKQLQQDLSRAGFLIGWPAPQLTACQGSGCTGAFLRMLLGWLVTALAVTLGAPFWFDVLNKFMVIRSTVKPSEKSLPEASKDSRPAPPQPGGA